MALRAFLTVLVILGLLVLPLIFYRISVVLDPKRPKPSRTAEQSTHLLIVLGSGGHTAEMIAMLTRAIGGSATPDPESELEITGTKLDWAKFTHRTWVVGEGDSISAQRAKDFEDMASKQPTNSTTAASAENNYNINTVPRARKIHQPLLTAPSSSLSCALACVHILLEAEAGFPNVILVNGPATATILVFTAVLLRFFNVRGCHSKGKMRVVYVESWARVKKLSLSGMLLEGVVERFLMQWPQLVEEGKQKKSWWSGGRRREYLGVLV